MRQSMLIGAAALASFTIAQSSSSDDDSDNASASPTIVEGCYPSDTPEAPCIQIGIIEEVCMQDGISYADHQRCICEGSFFQDWEGCQECLRVNGAFGEAPKQRWLSIASTVSSSLCDASGEPTAYFADVFASVAPGAGDAMPTSEAGEDYERQTLVTDDAVSAYYTVPDNQGPGITPTVTPQTETETETSSTETGSERESETGSSGEDEEEEEEGEPDVAGRVYAQGAAVVAMIMAGAALAIVA